MGTRLRNPLVLALVAALIPVAALGVWLGPVRALTAHHSTAAATSTASSTPSPTPSPTPRPTPLPELSVADRLDLGAPDGFGRVQVHLQLPLASADSALDMPVAGYSLATTPHGFPTSLPVWRARGFASDSIAGLAARLGMPTNASPPPGDDIDARTGAARATETRIPIPGNPTTSQLAIAAAGDVLRSLGVMPRNSHATATESGDAPHREWQVSFMRNRLAGVQVGLDAAAEASLTVDEDGWVTTADIEEQAVDGGSTYALRDWHQAWSDVTHHNWTVLCCLGPNGNGGAPDTDPGGSRYVLRVDSVYLYYEQSDTDPEYLVPFYAFKDSRFGIEVAVPALRSGDVSIVR